MTSAGPSGTSPAFIPVILAGGSGERFWPLSRRNRPKQFLSLDDSGRSLLQSTSDRLADLSGGPEAVMVVTSTDYRSQVLEQLPDLPLENLLIEPVARDTAPAILYAALRIAAWNEDAVMGVFPSDHRIGNLAAFNDVIRQAVTAAEETGKLVTVGITPTFASTGYGYIQRGEAVAEHLFNVTRFAEKPDAETARAFLEEGTYSWNSGMFIWKVRIILDAFRKYQPKMYAQLAEVANERFRTRAELTARFEALEKISIDYAILEKADQVLVIPADFGWDDLGDWNALERLLGGDGRNVAVGRHVGLDTGGAILYTTNGDDLIATIGLEDVVVVRSHDVTLVVRKDRTQDIKKFVQELKSRPETEKFI